MSEKSKEELLEELKKMVLALKNDAEELKKNPELAVEWAKKQAEIGIACRRLNSCDASWLNDEYGKWFRSEVKPAMDNLPDDVKEQLIWK